MRPKSTFGYSFPLPTRCLRRVVPYSNDLPPPNRISSSSSRPYLGREREIACRHIYDPSPIAIDGERRGGLSHWSGRDTHRTDIFHILLASLLFFLKGRLRPPFHRLLLLPPSFPRRHCSSYRDQDIEFALRLQLSHFAPLTLTAWGNSTYESGFLSAHHKSGKILLFL